MEYSYIPRDQIAGDSAFIVDVDEGKHLVRVLRRKPGDTVRFVDGEGWIYEGVLSRVSPEIEIEITDRRKDRDEVPVEVTLTPALLKGSRLDMVVEKATELGVASIIPMDSSRTVAGGKPGAQRLDRWRRIALSAMKQSLQARLPRVGPSMSFENVLGSAASYDLALIAWEEEKEKSVAMAAGTGAKSVLLMIGPEGGFSRHEIAMAREAGIQPVSLGRTRLRSDTASIVGLARLLAALDAP